MLWMLGDLGWGSHHDRAPTSICTTHWTQCRQHAVVFDCPQGPRPTLIREASIERPNSMADIQADQTRLPTRAVQRPRGHSCWRSGSVQVRAWLLHRSCLGNRLRQRHLRDLQAQLPGRSCHPMKTFESSTLENNWVRSTVPWHGFPCNDFSVVGERKGIDGTFGPLYEYGARVVDGMHGGLWLRTWAG